MSMRIVTPLTVAAAVGAFALAPACRPAPAAPALVPLVAPSASAPSRRVVLERAVFERPSELTPVTDDRPDPEAQRLFEQRMAQAGVPLLPVASPPKVTSIALDDTRRGEAPEMKPAGDVFMANLAEGQRGTMPVKVGAGECVAFIAQGGLGVIEVDLFLTSEKGAAGKILAEDPTTGPIAVIGGRGKCVTGVAGTGTDAVLNVTVRRGAGVVLVREYRR